MHTRELIDLAAFIVAQGRVLVETLREVPGSALAQYWTASKCRLDRWKLKLREVELLPADREIATRNLRSIGEEVLVSEMLTRIWSCILISVDVALGADEARPIAASVLAGQLEASNQVLGLIAIDRSNAPSAASELNRLRKLTERWTDLLLAGLGPEFAISDFAHDAARAAEFARDFVQTNRPASRLQAWGLLTASLKATFDAQLLATTPNADLNQQIAGSIVGCFPAEAFDSTGAYHSLWMLRLTATANDTQLLVEQFLAADVANAVPATFLYRAHSV